MIMAIIGFLAPFLPDVIGYFKAGQDHRHEMEMLRLRGEQANQEHLWRMEEVEIEAAARDRSEARKPHESYGIKLLDKAAEAKGMVWKWAFNLGLLAFLFIDWMISSVRPAITYWAFGLYAAVKMALLSQIYAAAAKFNDTAWDTAAAALTNEAAFTAFDQDLLLLVVSFWFGQRLKSGRGATP
jgi:hypothetical protein